MLLLLAMRLLTVLSCCNELPNPAAQPINAPVYAATQFAVAFREPLKVSVHAATDGNAAAVDMLLISAEPDKVDKVMLLRLACKGVSLVQQVFMLLLHFMEAAVVAVSAAHVDTS